ncbi:MAG: CoA transferase [Dehalococcoidia bacterium]|nr:CoA transferase [Dehalococcoidia bacterium]
MAPILSDCTVIEVGAGEAIAYCGRLLADAGARVIKVEPPGGDAARWETPRGAHGDPERSPLFLHLNAGKRSVVVDLETPVGVEQLCDLAARADILLESLTPSMLERSGITHERLVAANPELLRVSITPYGHTGPMRDFVATDLTLFASGGAMYREGLPEREPLRYAGHLPRTFSGSMAAGLLTAALLRRDRAGVGDWLDLSEMDCWASHPNQVTRRLVWEFSGDLEPREDTKLAANASTAGFGRGTYRARDGYITFLPLGDRHWPRLVELVEQPELTEDPRFATREARRTHRADWEAIFESYIAARPIAEVFRSAQRAGIPSAPLYDPARLLQDDHLAERGYWRTVTHPRAGNLKHPGVIARGPDGFWADLAAAPELGEANDRLDELLPRRTATSPASAATSDAPHPLPLAGVRALEIAEIWAGPFCGSLLADLGAEVIKVEAIQRSARGAVKPLPGAAGYPGGDPGDEPWNRNAAFLAVNRSKRGITLDLHQPEGQALLDQLLPQVDLVFTNLSLDAQESLQLLPARLLAVNPRLVVTLLTGYGLTGPYRYYRSMGMTLDAISGHSALRGYPDIDLSTITPVHHPDGISAAAGLFMSLLGLRHRERTGEGVVFDLAQFESTIPHLGEYLLDWQLAGVAAPRLGNDHPWMAPHGVFATRDPDTWLAVAVDTDERFGALAQAIGREDLLGRPEYATAAGRHQRRDELDRALAEWACTQDRFEAERALQAAGVPAAAVLRPDVDHHDHAQLLERGALRDADFGFGTFRYPAPPWRFTSTVDLQYSAPPRLGEHNAEVLGGLLGLDADALARLEQQQVIGTRPLETAEDPVAVRRH